MDLEDLKRMMMVLMFAWFFQKQMSTFQVAYQNHIEFSMISSNERLKRMILVGIMAYFYINQIINMQLAYLKRVEWRLSLVPRKKNKRNAPEPRTFMYYERTVLRLSATTFRSHFRLTRTTFNNLCCLLGPKMAPNVDGSVIGRPNTPIEKQILPVLWLLATPDSYRSVADRFNISKGTLVLFFNRFVDVLNDIASQYIRWPQRGEMLSVRKKFYKIAQFGEWVIGAIDGAYIVIPAPKENPEVFRTRKHNFALTLQAICLATLQFTSCFVGFPASVGDKRIFDNSPIYKDILRSKNDFFPNNEFIIGDKAYPVLDWCQAPYIRRFALNEAQEIYNHCLSATRQVIERAFGLLFGRFRRLKFLDMNKDSSIPKTVIACCVLHNLALDEKNYEDFIKEGMLHVMENKAIDHATTGQYQPNTDGERRRGEIAARLHRQRILANTRSQNV